jgi:hypothetical protein
MPERLYSYDTSSRVAQHFQNMATEIRPFIRAEHAAVHLRRFTRHRHVGPTDQPHIRNGMLWGVTRVSSDQSRAGAGAASDAIDADGFDRFC